MTDNKHTPGPWFPKQDLRHTQNTGALNDGSPKAWAVYGKYRVACIEESLGVDWNKDTEAQGNAHLIAAAPELLAALEAVRDWCVDIEENGKTYQSTNIQKNIVWAKVRDAIAKAKGE